MSTWSSSSWTNAVSETASSTSATSRRNRLVSDDDHAVVAYRPRFEQAERLGRRGVAEEALAVTEHHGIHHQPELVDEILVDQRTDEGRAARDEDLALRVFLQLRDFVGDVAFDPARVVPRQRLQRRGDDVLRHRVHLVREAGL